MAVKFQDYYEVLGTTRTTSQDDIQKAYRKLARKYHPDVNQSKDAEERFKKINEAYDVLKDPKKRRKYDQLGPDWQQGQEFRPPPGWKAFKGNNIFGFDFGGSGSRSFDDGETSGFSDFFELLFGGGARPRGAGPGSFRPGGSGPTAAQNGTFSPKARDQEAELSISLEEAYLGTKKTITLAGVGRRNGRSDRTLEVNIPSGTPDGRRLRLSGQGGQTNGQASAGDLYLKIHINPHPDFRISASDLELDVAVAPWEAALGAKVDVPLIDGRVSLKIPAGTPSGRRLRLKGKGLRKEGEQRGDLFAVVQIVVPKALSTKERELFEELAKTSSFNPRQPG